MASLTVGDITTRVQRQFGDETNAQISEQDVIRWINDAMRDIVLNVGLLQVRAVTTVLDDENEYSLPTDILKLQSVKYNGVALRGISIQEADELVPDRDNTDSTPKGTPQYFWTFANNITLYPTPDATLTDGLRVYYNRIPTDVAATGDVPELPVEYHNRIVEYCLAQAFELDENYQVAQYKLSQFQDGVDRLKGNEDWPVQEFYPGITTLPDDMGY
jgi:hypothetical protein